MWKFISLHLAYYKLYDKNVIKPGILLSYQNITMRYTGQLSTFCSLLTSLVPRPSVISSLCCDI